MSPAPRKRRLRGIFREYAQENPGLLYDRHAIERVGLFTFPPGLSPLPKAITKTDKDKAENSRYRGAQFITSGLKTKDGTCDAYFDKEYRRIFEKEAISRPPKAPKVSKKDKMAKNEKKQGPFLPIIPPNPTKLHSTPGDGYGCFSTYSHFRFAPEKIPKKGKKQSSKPTKDPNKTTIGYTFLAGHPGYLNPYPPAFDPKLKTISLKKQKEMKEKDKKMLGVMVLNHVTADYLDPNPYFVEEPKSTYIETERKMKIPKGQKVLKPLPTNTLPWIPIGEPKQIGGGKFGTFDEYPAYFSPLLKSIKKDKKGQKDKKEKSQTFVYYGPQVWAENISSFTPSVTQKVIDMQCNQETYRDYKPTHVAQYLPRE